MELKHSSKRLKFFGPGNNTENFVIKNGQGAPGFDFFSSQLPATDHNGEETTLTIFGQMKHTEDKKKFTDTEVKKTVEGEKILQDVLEIRKRIPNYIVGMYTNRESQVNEPPENYFLVSKSNLAAYFTPTFAYRLMSRD